MNIDEQIQKLVVNYENSIYDLLKQIIDEGIQISITNQLDDIDTFLYIDTLLVNTYDKFANYFNNSASESELWLIKHFPNIESKIDALIQPLIIKARSELQMMISEVYDTKTYSELSEKTKKLENYFIDKNIKKYDCLLENLEIGDKFLLPKSTKNYSKTIKPRSKKYTLC